MLITLSGLPGSGTSTVARTLASRLGVDHLDGGTVFRSAASERGLSLAAFAQLAETDDSIDRALDERLLDRARAGSVLLESRLAGWLAHRAGLVAEKIWVACDDDERARRVGGRDGADPAEARRVNDEREASERARYRSYYGIDLLDLSIYDQVIDSTQQSPESIVEQIAQHAERRFASS